MGEQVGLDDFTEEEREREDTQKVRLKHLARINPTKSEISDVDPETKISFVSLDDFGTDGAIKNTETRKLEDVYDGYTYFREGDIAIAKITPSFENGKGAICRGLNNNIGFGTTELHILRPREGVSTEFLWYVLRSKPFIQEAKAAMRGVAGQKRVPTTFLEDFEVESHPEEIQRAIAKRIESNVRTIDESKKYLQELKDSLEEKRLSTLWNEITCESASGSVKQTDVPWLGEVPESWDVAKIGWYYDIQLGKMLDESEISGENLAPYLRNQDVHWWDINTQDLPKMDFSEKEKDLYRLKPGDVLVCEGGAGRGESAVWNKDMTDIYYQKALHRVRAKSDEQVPEFFCYFMEFAVKTGIFSAESNQSTIDHITVEKLSNQIMPIPPKEEQQDIVARLNRVSDETDDLISTIDDLTSRLLERREAVITKGITGQIDVTVPQNIGEETSP